MYTLAYEYISPGIFTNTSERSLPLHWASAKVLLISPWAEKYQLLSFQQAVSLLFFAASWSPQYQLHQSS